MRDVDIIDRRHTTVSPMQRSLLVLALVLVLAIAFHANPALWLWYDGQYRIALVVAALWPSLCLGALGFLSPVVGCKRGKMSHRVVRITLIVSSGIALLLCGTAVGVVPRLLPLHPANPGSTVWFGSVQRISLFAALAGYAIGLALGTVLALFLKSSVRTASKDGESQ